jgi:hypothetical protein
MFNFIDMYSFIPVSGCVDMAPSVLLWSGAYNAVKTALTRGSINRVSLLRFLVQGQTDTK